MKVSLRGLFSNIKGCLPPKDKGYYAFALDEVLEHIQGVVNGKYSLEEFAEHYCIERQAHSTASKADSALSQNGEG